MSSLVIPAVSFLSYHAEQEQKLICRRQKASRLCKIMQCATSTITLTQAITLTGHKSVQLQWPIFLISQRISIDPRDAEAQRMLHFQYRIIW